MARSVGPEAHGMGVGAGWVCGDSELGATPVMDWKGSREESSSLYIVDRNYPYGLWDGTSLFPARALRPGSNSKPKPRYELKIDRNPTPSALSH